MSAPSGMNPKDPLQVVDGWKPLAVGTTLNDDQFFEIVTAAVFQARFRPAIVKARWPYIRRGFADFDLRTVAAWPDDRLTNLLEVDGMIRNPKKIRATLANARALLALSEAFGGLEAYLRSFDTDREALVRDIDTWARYIGAPSIRWVVQAVDRALPSG